MGDNVEELPAKTKCNFSPQVALVVSFHSQSQWATVTPSVILTSHIFSPLISSFFFFFFFSFFSFFFFFLLLRLILIHSFSVLCYYYCDTVNKFVFSG